MKQRGAEYVCTLPNLSPAIKVKEYDLPEDYPVIEAPATPEEVAEAAAAAARATASGLLTRPPSEGLITPPPVDWV